MRKFIVPLALALLAAAPAASFAATAAPAATAQGEQTTSGVIKLVNPTARSLELADGSWYYMPFDFKAPDMKAGDKVTVHWHSNGSAHDITSVDLG
ncbi:DUF1344 domain-containing protein [Devosia rhizoryzae]|uniref:DUF1344 domain-containing protein n=1 Tax=Devosia rhizoryzae TaxID=2774137 RepID=A0ABX7CEH9_9HYPH|nr:DUF1344 domain-containing protein [Devosia rhizoryzae]QQR40331.1 DUF1344 domain-containing protein [Devosia rhizoryzae]